MENQAAIELKKIEDANDFWNMQWKFEHEVWSEICMQINSHQGEDQKLWNDVMDLYHKKYPKTPVTGDSF